MTAIICTAMICATVLVLANKLAKLLTISNNDTQHTVITEEDLEKAYKDNPDIPDFQKVIQYINEEFSGVNTEDNNG